MLNITGGAKHPPRHAVVRRPRFHTIARALLLLCTIRFQLDSQSIGNPIHKCVVGCNRADIVNRAVPEPGLTKTLHIGRRDLLRLTRQLDGVIEHRAIRIVRCGGPVIGPQRRNQTVLLDRCPAFRLEESTEPRPVVMYSIMAPVDCRDDDRNHLPLDPAERSGATHQLNIKLVMLSHDSAVYSMNTDDVVAISNAIARRDLIVGLIGYECHRCLRKLYSIVPSAWRRAQRPDQAKPAEVSLSAMLGHSAYWYRMA